MASSTANPKSQTSAATQKNAEESGLSARTKSAAAKSSATKAKLKRRALPAEDRRQQLIKATIKCIARQGLSATTMANITSEAGLSMGIVNLHFQSKEKLLVETLRTVADEYLDGWRTITRSNTLEAAEKIRALIEFDFSAKVTQREKLAVWFAFWGEAKSRPVYQKICAKNDNETAAQLNALCLELLPAGPDAVEDADIAASGYTALVDGLWLDILLTPREMPREKAIKICLNYLGALFPEQF
ncbi:MAG: transcriptional regulator BetI [Pseudomonadales bacterium]